MITLYKVDAKGSLYRWCIEQIDTHAIQMKWGLSGGAMQVKKEHIETNKSGRSLQEQVESRIKTRINFQLDKGYCSTIKEARKSIGLNASKLFKPMLAKVYDYNKHTNFKHYFWQFKYNGHRCLITRVGDDMFAYSRNGKPITTIEHILKELSIPDGYTLDGELYIHNSSLQYISSLVKRVQEDNIKLNYIVYDCITDNVFAERFEFLSKLKLPSSVKLALTNYGAPLDIASNAIINSAKDKGYEGFMIRQNTKPYEPGKRSDQLLKVKSRLDCEATVVAINPSKDGWAILSCLLPNGKTFDVVAPGSREEKVEVLENKHLYIGRLITVEFAELTAYGTPFHPIAIDFRQPE